jgi:AraC-like DNA-binding protein
MDVLGSVLQSLRLRGSVYCHADLSAPWGVGFPQTKDALFHVFDRGSGWVRMDGLINPIAVKSGDVLLFPHGTPHQLSDRPGGKVVSLAAVIRPPGNACARIQRGGGGGLTSLICGGFSLEDGDLAHPVLSLLPPMIHLSGQSGQVAPFLETTLRFLLAEAGSERPGSVSVTTRLTEVLFIQVLRVWLESAAAQERAGWMSGLTDPQLARALELIHEKPSHPWTVDSLARAAAMSRSVFAARFHARIGEPPLRYLTRWRLSEAARALREGEHSIAEIATRFGYESQAAFTKAFVREFRTSPGAYRRQHTPTA